jgi:type IV pilus assembly protein PilM
MSLLDSIMRLVKDPPPAHVFELSEAGVAHSSGAETGFEPLPSGALEVSPVEDNVRQAELILPVLDLVAAPKVGAARGSGGVGAARGSKSSKGSKRRTAAVLLPDACARVSVLDFDAFPAVPSEQAALVRFRVKKTVPFDIESAAVGYYVQPGSDKKAKTEVVAVTIALEVLARYEALFRNAGFHAGVVTVSGLAMLNLYKGHDAAMLAKLAGKTLTLMVVAAGRLRLFRCLTLEGGGEQASEEEIRSVLFPTFAYAEDELGAPIRRVILCGFAAPLENLPCESEPLRGRFGAPGPFNAGLLGYLEAVTL